MKHTQLTCDIVIPQYKEVWLLNRCLMSLTQITIPTNITTIIVVENGGVFGASKIVDKFKQKLPLKYTYIDEGNLSKARNEGIKLSTSDVIIFFDNDMKFYTNTLTSYLDTISTYGDAYFFGGALEPDYEEIPPQWLITFLPNSAKGFSLGEDVVEHNQPDFLGGNHAVFRSHLLAINGYDTNCASGNNEGAVGEETRLQQKLLSKGYVGVYIPSAKVKHYVPKSNCSKKWILKRAERSGITKAVENRDNEYRKFMGIPTFHIRQLVTNLFKVCIYFWSPELRFKANYEIRYLFGVISQYLKLYFNKN